MPAPPVSISILNYQRRDLLRRVVASAVSQDYPRLEVLVVDNASTDGSEAMLRDEFPAVRVVALPENVGCAARNAGVAAARGDIVVTLDNDVLLRTPRDVARIVEIFGAHPSAACVNFKILNAEGRLSTRDWCHPRDWRRFEDEEFPTDYVLEGASAHRRGAFLEVGGYWKPLFIGHEGLDLALRLINAGHDLLYSPAVEVMHVVAAEARPSSRIYYTFTRNGIWVALRNQRTASAAVEVAKELVLMGFSAARAGEWAGYFRGVWHGLLGARDALASRRPLAKAAVARLRTIRRFEPSALEKVKRHWIERPI